MPRRRRGLRPTEGRRHRRRRCLRRLHHRAAPPSLPAPGSSASSPASTAKLLDIPQSGIQLRGTGARPEDVVLTYDNSAGTAGGTTKSASITVSGDDFYAENLTIENSFSRNRPLKQEGSQAVALKITGDRAVFRKVRFLGYQDTLYANSKRCETDKGPCEPARQYFSECYIEGNVDFIFGDALAFFDRCEIHALAHSVIMLTAQSRHYAEEKSGYVFDHCRITAEKGADRVYLGRPWRAYSTVVFLNTEMPAADRPRRLARVGARRQALAAHFLLRRVPFRRAPARAPIRRKQLTAAEAARFALKTFLAGDDHWDPTKVH